MGDAVSDNVADKPAGQQRHTVALRAQHTPVGGTDTSALFHDLRGYIPIQMMHAAQILSIKYTYSAQQRPPARSWSAQPQAHDARLTNKPGPFVSLFLF